MFFIYTSDISKVLVKFRFCLQFRAARKAAEDIGAQIVLGDRPIEITVCCTYT